MSAFPDHDYIQSYERAAAQLAGDSDNRDLQHSAVLALARAGALDFARREYTRFGLAGVEGHEDIMSLGARLEKDLFLRGGPHAGDHAARSAGLYDAAFDATGGYYSGINAATMALMAGMPEKVVSARAEAIREALPVLAAVNPQERYYTRATLAETYLLTDDRPRAAQALQSAVDFDPLNYAAHATTLKQFRMIAEKQGAPSDWLSDFSPPRSVHFAGHILGPSADEDSLAVALSDVIQARDIGFGYGALAAGSDILMAEALIEEGAELHVVLPADIESFTAKSVRPFGAQWRARFDACMDAASSVLVLTGLPEWPDPRANRYAGRVAMGRAIMRGQMLSADAAQLLIYDESAAGSYTAAHAVDWASVRAEQFIVPLPGYEKKAGAKPAPDLDCRFTVQGEKTVQCSAAQLVSALSIAGSQNTGVVVTAGLSGREETSAASDSLVSDSLRAAVKPGHILMSEEAACMIMFEGIAAINIVYAGQPAAGLRAYSASLTG